MVTENDAEKPSRTIEVEILNALDAGDADRAATLLLKAFGPELLTYAAGQHRNEDDAADVFSIAAEAIWRGLPAFRRESSVRTWCYAVTRRVSMHFFRDEGRRKSRFRSIESKELIDNIVAKARTETLSFLRTERGPRLAALRAALSEEERELLTLRIDRRMSWNDLALVLLPAESHPTEATIKRFAARLRQRFQALKQRLRDSAKREGLIGLSSRD